MRVLGVALLCAAVFGALAVAGTAGGSHAGSPAPASFRLADGSVGCAFDGGRLACRARDAATAVVLNADGSSEADDVAVEWDTSTPVLHAAESWWHGGYSCSVDSGGAAVCDRGNGSITVGVDRIGGASSTTATLP